jgi:hypothetical protein
VTTEGDLTKAELQDMAEQLGLSTSGTKDELAARIEEAQADDADAEAEEGVKAEQPEAVGPTGPTLTPDEPRHAATLAEAGEPQANPNTFDDGVEDIELGPPVVGQFVLITGGDYAGRFAAYLGDVGTLPDDDPEKVIQVRTRDADNLLVDVLYSDVSSTTYSGGR